MSFDNAKRAADRKVIWAQFFAPDSVLAVSRLDARKRSFVSAHPIPTAPWVRAAPLPDVVDAFIEQIAAEGCTRHSVLRYGESST